MEQYGMTAKEIQDLWNSMANKQISIDWKLLMESLPKKEQELAKMEEDKKTKIYNKPFITNLEKFLKEIKILYSILENNSMDVDFRNENIDLEGYQNKWKKATIRSVEVRRWNHHNNNNENTNFGEKARKRIEQDVEIIGNIFENIIIKRMIHDFVMARIYKLVLDAQEWFGEEGKKEFKKWKKNLLSFSGTILTDRMLNHYGEIFRLVSERKFMIYYPYSALLQVVKNTKGGFDEINLIMDNMRFPRGDIDIKSLQWNWNQSPSYFLNMEDAY